MRDRAGGRDREAMKEEEERRNGGSEGSGEMRRLEGRREGMEEGERWSG